MVVALDELDGALEDYCWEDIGLLGSLYHHFPVELLLLSFAAKMTRLVQSGLEGIPVL